MIDRALVRNWLAGYEAAWRAAGTERLAELFTADATYLQSPYELPRTGLPAIARMWEEEREGPDEVFTVATDILAVDGPTAVVRAEVIYGDPPRQEYRDLWILRLGDDGRCISFEEWPYWPERLYDAGGDPATTVLQRVDAVTVPVSDLDAGLRFYRDSLGHELRWRNDQVGQAGLRLPGSDTELVLTTRQAYEPNWLVASADHAAAVIEAAGGRVVTEPFDIPVGRVAVVADPFGNTLVLVDLSKGHYVTDDAGNVTAVVP